MNIFLYNPDRKNKQEFIAEFVIRTKIFDDIFADIKAGKMKVPEQHYLLQGQHGAGKTTMLLRLKYAVEDDPILSGWLIPVIFSEEQYNIGELGNLWERIAEYLEDYHGFNGIIAEMMPVVHSNDQNYEEALLRILLKHLDQHKKKIILFVDNIGQLLTKFSDLEVRRLREILQTIPHFRLVAGSPVALDSVLDYQQPLFEFFKIIQLKGLNDEECILLLRKLAVLNHEEDKIERIIKESPTRITTLRTLSGGVPRTMALLFQVFVDNEHGTALSDLEKILDAVTPLYKHRMDDLPPQQQKIVDAVALHWEAISVKELTKVTRLDSKLVSAQLRQLEKNQVIEKRATGTKNHIYLLRERFFNIWYLMRYGRKQNRNRVIWLVRFLEAWCDKSEIERRIMDYISKAQKGLLDENLLEVYGHVYTFFQEISAETKLLLKESVPECIAGNVNLTESEYYSLLDANLEKGDFNAFLRVANSRRATNIEESDRLLDYIDKYHEIFIREQNLKEFIKPDNYKSTLFMIMKDGKIYNSSFVYIFAVTIICRSIASAVSMKNADQIKKGVESLVLFLKTMSAEPLIGKVKNYVFVSLFLLLADRKYSYGLHIIEHLSLPEEEFIHWNSCVEYIKSIDQSSDTFLTANTEMKEALLLFADAIFKVRKKLEGS